MGKSETATLILILIILFSHFAVFRFVPDVKANPDWLSGWDYRKSHVINSASGAGTNYQVKIVAHYGSGTDSGEDVYLNSHAQSDFDDVRFTDDDGTTLLDYWNETIVVGDYAVFWVEVADDLSSSSATIYIYYGKSDATTTSNGDNTFLFFDDFPGTSLNGTKWTRTHGSAVVNVANSIFKIHSSDGSWCGKGTENSWTGGYAARGRVKLPVDTNIAFFCGATDPIASETQNAIKRYSGYSNFYSTVGDGTNKAHVESTVPKDTSWHTMEMRRTASTSVADIDGTSWANNQYANNDSRPIWFCNPDASIDLEVDWVLIRKYVDPEPSHGSWGAEEETQPENSISQDSPSDGATVTSWTVNFNYTVTFYDTPKNASFRIFNATDNSLIATVWNNTALVNGTSENYGSYTFNTEQTYKWDCIYYNNTGSSWQSSSNYTLTIDVPSRYQNVGSNSTSIQPNGTIKLYAQGYDGIGLDWAWLATNETGSWKNYTELGTFSSRAQSILNKLYNAFNVHYNNRVSGMHVSDNGDGIYQDWLGILGMQIYFRDHNSTILEISRKALEEAYNNRDTSTNMLRKYDTGTSSWVSAYQYRMYMVVDAIGAMAVVNSTFADYFETLVKAYNNYAYNSTTNLVYYYLKSDNTKDNSKSYVHASFSTSTLVYFNYHAYSLTGNTTYLNITAKLIDGYWKHRSSVYLLPHELDADTNSTTLSYTKENAAGAWMQMLAFLINHGCETLSYDGTTLNITDILDKCSKSYSTHFWTTADGGRWVYRLNPDGSVASSEAVHGFISFDRGLYMAYEIFNNETFKQRIMDDMINDFNVLGSSTYHSIIDHTSGANDFRWTCTCEYAQLAYVLYNKFGNTTLKNNADDIIDEGLDYFIDSNGYIYGKFDGSSLSSPQRFEGYNLIESIENATQFANLTIGTYYYFFICLPAKDNYFLYKSGTYDSPLDMNDVADTWTWANFTWSNSSITSGTTIAWRIYFNDTYGNENATSVQTFLVSSGQLFEVDLTQLISTTLVLEAKSEFTLTITQSITSSFTQTLTWDSIVNLQNQPSVAITQTSKSDFTLEVSNPISASLTKVKQTDFTLTPSNSITATFSSATKTDFTLKINKQISTSYTLTPTWNTKTNPANLITVTTTCQPQTDFKLALLNPTSTSLTFDAVANFLLNIPNAISNMLSLTPKWNSLLTAHIQPSITVQKTTETDFKLSINNPITTSWLIDIIHTAVGNYIVNLACSITNTLTTLLQTNLAIHSSYSPSIMLTQKSETDFTLTMPTTITPTYSLTPKLNLNLNVNLQPSVTIEKLSQTDYLLTTSNPTNIGLITDIIHSTVSMYVVELLTPITAALQTFQTWTTTLNLNIPATSTFALQIPTTTTGGGAAPTGGPPYQPITPAPPPVTPQPRLQPNVPLYVSAFFILAVLALATTTAEPKKKKVRFSRRIWSADRVKKRKKRVSWKKRKEQRVAWKKRKKVWR